MKRLLPSCAAAIALLAVPAAASAQTGAVLRVNRAHHKLEIVDGQHAVRSYTTSSRRAVRKLRAGVKVSFQAQAGRITSLRPLGRAHKISFLAKVVSASNGKGLTLRLGDGDQLRLGRRQLARHRQRAHRSTVQINIQGLDPGQVVLITETVDGPGNETITIKLMPSADPNGDDQDATGTITALGIDSVTIQTEGGESMTFQADPMLLEDFSVGDAVDVSYYPDADGSLVADDVEPLDDSGSEDLDAIGTVTAIADGSITVQIDGSGPMTFQADSELVDGVSVGDLVDVTYFQDTDRSLVADDIEPADDSGDSGGSGDDSGD
jgi:Domain of unknown function (DUF5666)